ncbi:putative FAD/NAD(P)-binding domain-containing protein [Seiridium cardinale]
MALLDAAIIGGGPAGLSAAATLARQLHTAVVFDSRVYRNARSHHMHMVPGWENRDPNEFRATAKQDVLANYSTIQFADVRVEKIEKKTDSHFLVSDASGKVWGFRKVILALGSENVFPSIEGYEQLWAEKIYHCLFCKGYEDRGAPSAGVLAVPPLVIPPMAILMAMDVAQLADKVTLYTHGNDELAQQLASISSTKFRVESRAIKRLVGNAASNAVTVEFADGSSKEEKFLAHNPQTKVQGPFVAQLGITLTQTGDIQADAPMHQTSVRGVFAAGDCITPYKVVPGAISSGCNAAVAASAQLHAEEYGQQPLF